MISAAVDTTTQSFPPSLQSDMSNGRMIKALLNGYDKNTRPNFETGKCSNLIAFFEQPDQYKPC